MRHFKRFFLFALVNILVVVTLSVIVNLLGITPYLGRYGINYTQLAAFSLVWGFGGSFISLLMSRMMAKMIMGVQVIDPQTASGEALTLVHKVHQLATQAGLSTMPEVGIYQSPEVNAFATGPSRSRSLVAVSTGLLNQMNGSQVEGVLAHEVAHIANGDMVTMTLLQGVINAFVLFFARVIAFAVGQTVREDARHWVRILTTFVLEIILSILGVMVVAAFSRWREYRADRSGATLAGSSKMISALQALQRTTALVDNSQASLASFKISGKKGWLALFATHPPLEQRIRRLQDPSLAG